MNILVSGISGDIGFGVARILNSNNWHGKIHGMDIKSDHPGVFMCDYTAISPRANESNYIEWLYDYIINHEIKVFVPTSEAEILRLTIENLNVIAGAFIIKSNDMVIRKCLDKYECLNYLSSSGVPVPKHGLLSIEEPVFYPVIIKPRTGQGSKGLLKVCSEDQLPIDPDPDLVWQDYLEPDEEEYTCPIFRSTETGVRSLIIKRTLQGGFTDKGEVINNEEIDTYINLIAEALDLDGVMNIQLRLTSQGPRLFEINPRLSSTLVFRDKMGFCDLDWLLSLRLGLSIAEYIPPAAGTRFYRGVQEYISLT